jgi:hypothetical protein
VQVTFKLILLLFLFSCGSTLVPDRTPLSSIEGNYPTVEFSACGELWHGLGACVIKPEEDLSSLNIKIQGYNDGTMRVISSGCPKEIDRTFSYKENQNVRINLEGNPNQDCLLSFVVSPDFSRQRRRNAVVVESLEGHLYIRRSSANAIVKTSKTRRNELMQIPSSVPSRVLAISSFCEARFDEVLDPVNNLLELNLEDIIDLNRPRLCIINGVAEEVQTLLVWYAAVYNKDYSPLARPLVNIKGNRLEVTANANVSVVSLNDEYIFSNVASFQFNKSRPNVLRVLTAKGRSVLAEWNQETGEFEWK